VHCDVIQSFISPTNAQPVSLILHCAWIHTQNRTELIGGHTTEQFINEVY